MRPDAAAAPEGESDRPMHLSREEESRIDARVAALEGRTGAQVVAAVIGKCDAYPEIPWKAFALGVALATLVAALASQLQAGWHAPGGALIQALAVLGSGAAAAALAVFVPPFARLFLDPLRAEAEVRQYAQAMFLARELYRTPAHIGILLLVSRFERKIVILPDTGVRRRIAEADLAAVIAAMAEPLRADGIAPALHAGLDALEAQLAKRGFAGGAKSDEIAEALVQEKGG